METSFFTGAKLRKRNQVVLKITRVESKPDLVFLEESVFQATAEK